MFHAKLFISNIIKSHRWCNGYRTRLDYTICICCFSARNAELRRKNKDWLVRNQDNVSKWGDTFIRGLLFQWASTIKNPTKRVGLVQSGPHHHFKKKSNSACWSRTKRTSSSSLWKLTCSRHDIAEKLPNWRLKITRVGLE